MLQAKRRDEREKQRMAEESERPRRRETAQRSARSSHGSRGAHAARTADRAPRASEKRASSPRDIDDDFDYDKEMSDIDRMLDETDRGNTDLD